MRIVLPGTTRAILPFVPRWSANSPSAITICKGASEEARPAKTMPDSKTVIKRFKRPARSQTPRVFTTANPALWTTPHCFLGHWRIPRLAATAMQRFSGRLKSSCRIMLFKQPPQHCAGACCRKEQNVGSRQSNGKQHQRGKRANVGRFLENLLHHARSHSGCDLSLRQSP